MTRLTHLTATLATLATVAATGAVALTSGPALGAISNFTFVGIEGVGALRGNLSSRLGTTVNATTHIINIEDCHRYAGGEADWTVRISPLPQGDWQYAAAFAGPGRTCPTTSANPESTASCTVLRAQRELTTTEVTFRIPFDDLIGGDCDAGTEGTASVYFIIEEPLLPQVAHERIEVRIDLRRPVAPTIEDVVGGDTRFTVSWSDDANDSADTEYVVYWDEVDFTEDALATVNAVRGIKTKSYSVQSNRIINGLPYYVRVAAVDSADNESPLSETLSVIPEETIDFWERYQAAGGTEVGGFCFIATAAWGTPMAGELATLRSFRDDLLLHSAAGRAFVESYYRWGRFLAAWIADKPALRTVVRVLLVPLLWLAQLSLLLGPLAASAVVGAGLFALIWMRRRIVAILLRDVPLAEARR